MRRPSGICLDRFKKSLDASGDDVEFNRTMAKAGELMGISLYDHLIVSARGFVSLKERGLV